MRDLGSLSMACSDAPIHILGMNTLYVRSFTLSLLAFIENQKTTLFRCSLACRSWAKCAQEVSF